MFIIEYFRSSSVPSAEANSKLAAEANSKAASSSGLSSSQAALSTIASSSSISSVSTSSISSISSPSVSSAAAQTLSSEALSKALINYSAAISEASKDSKMNTYLNALNAVKNGYLTTSAGRKSDKMTGQLLKEKAIWDSYGIPGPKQAGSESEVTQFTKYVVECQSEFDKVKDGPIYNNIQTLENKIRDETVKLLGKNPSQGAVEYVLNAFETYPSLAPIIEKLPTWFPLFYQFEKKAEKEGKANLSVPLMVVAMQQKPASPSLTTRIVHWVGTTRVIQWMSSGKKDNVSSEKDAKVAASKTDGCFRRLFCCTRKKETSDYTSELPRSLKERLITWVRVHNTFTRAALVTLSAVALSTIAYISFSAGNSTGYNNGFAAGRLECQRNGTMIAENTLPYGNQILTFEVGKEVAKEIGWFFARPAVVSATWIAARMPAKKEIITAATTAIHAIAKYIPFLK